MIIALNQNVLVERDKDKSNIVVRKSGIVTPTGQVENEGLVTGKVLFAPKDQNLLIDKSRPINEREIRVGDVVWYSKYSTGIILDDREGHDGEFLDLVPLEDLRAIIE
jgi:co-chaperonin GroES (HSP10)